MKISTLFTVVLLSCLNAAGGDFAAKITRIDGSAHMMKYGTEAWFEARLGMRFCIDDQVKCGAESLVEITYKNGEIIRLAENTTFCIKKSSLTSVTTSVPIGNVWVNMKKLTSIGREFNVATPTAVAAIRGTVFQMQSHPDSSADVAVFDGKVAVGLSDDGKKRVAGTGAPASGAPHEVPGPTEVPGPYEVTLDQWRTIIAGQRISIRSNGTYATTVFDLDKQADSFIEKNRALDREIKGAR